jgi:Mg2+-importing ATPase
VGDAQRLGPLRPLWRQVESPLVLILIFAAGVSLSLSKWVDAAIILAIAIGSTLLGFYQAGGGNTSGREVTGLRREKNTLRLGGVTDP